MKKIFISIAIIAILSNSFTGCKKSDTQVALTPLQKMQAKWQLVTYAENDHFSGADHFKNLTGGVDDYLDFRVDGKVYVSLFGTKDTSTYAMSGDTRIVIDGSLFLDIKTLTDKACVLYGKDVFGADFLEQTFTMRK